MHRVVDRSICCMYMLASTPYAKYSYQNVSTVFVSKMQEDGAERDDVPVFET